MHLTNIGLAQILLSNSNLFILLIVFISDISDIISELNNKEITDKEVTNFLINVRKIKF